MIYAIFFHFPCSFLISYFFFQILIIKLVYCTFLSIFQITLIKVRNNRFIKRYLFLCIKYHTYSPTIRDHTNKDQPTSDINLKLYIKNITYKPFCVDFWHIHYCTLHLNSKYAWGVTGFYVYVFFVFDVLTQINLY